MKQILKFIHSVTKLIDDVGLSILILWLTRVEKMVSQTDTPLSGSIVHVSVLGWDHARKSFD